jgi:lipid II:glycine glycyltransferase (peptidoglycan interpeptide bridge formation enzyme)
MIKYLPHNKVDKQKWDACISASKNSLVYNYSWYLDIAAAGWSAIIYSDYKAVMPICYGKKFTFEYIYPPYFVQQQGIFSPENIDASLTKLFFDTIPSNFKFIEQYLNTGNIFEPGGYKVTYNSTYHLLLKDNYEALSKNFSQNHKRNIKRAAENNLVISHEASTDTIISLFRNGKGREVKNLKDAHYKVLKELFHQCDHRQLLKFYNIKKDNRIICGGVFIVEGASAIFIFSGADVDSKNARAMTLLINQFIIDHSGTNITLDFEGSNIPGLARFYKGFGATEKKYMLVTKNLLPPPFKWLK